MEWALSGTLGVERVFEFEARLSLMLNDRPDLVICKYDLARFSDEAVLNVMRTHSLVLAAGVLQSNPLYMEPDRFLQEVGANPFSINQAVEPRLGN
jgi:hypothetical protein